MNWFKKLRNSKSVKRPPLPRICSECGEAHTEFSFSFALPAMITGWPESEIRKRVFINNDEKPDLIVVDDEHFFVRSVLEIPILDTDQVLTFGVWPTMSEDNFLKYQELYETPEREGIETFSWQLARMPHYASFVEDDYFEPLKATTVWQELPFRPKVYILETDHELYHDQTQGISFEKAQDIAVLCAHS